MGLRDKLNALNTNEPRKYWQFIKKMRAWGTGKDSNDEIQPSKWTSYFQSLFGIDNDDSRTHLPDNSSLKNPVFNKLDFSIKCEEISKAIKCLKTSKAAGFDNILNEFLISGKESLLQPLCIIFNRIFTSHTYPSMWSINFLRPVHKRDDRKDPDNYRGIAVGSCLGKLYSYVLLNRLELHIKEHDLIKNNQIGFMKGKQPADHMFVLKSLVDNIVKYKKKRMYAAFVDFKKAYDTINRGKLFLKLRQAKVGDTFLNSLKSMYSSVKYCVKLTNGYTNPISSDKGLKQGCVLSPMLFNLFIDDIGNIFDKTCCPVALGDIELNHLLYADDLILLSTSPEGLQNCLNALGTYSQQWDLTVSIKKSKTMVFNPLGKLITDNTFSYLGKPLEMVKEFSYLGIAFSMSGSFSNAIQTLKDKANKAMYPLVDTVFKFSLGVPTSMNLFEKLIQPVVLYGSEIWGALSHHQLSSIF